MRREARVIKRVLPDASSSNCTFTYNRLTCQKLAILSSACMTIVYSTSVASDADRLASEGGNSGTPYTPCCTPAKLMNKRMPWLSMASVRQRIIRPPAGMQIVSS